MSADLSYIDRLVQRFERSGTSIFIRTYLSDTNALVDEFECTGVQPGAPIPQEIRTIADSILANLVQPSIDARSTIRNLIKADCTPNGLNTATMQYRGGWSPSTVYNANDYIMLSNGLRIVCATGGTSGATIPSALSPTGTTLVRGTVATNLVTDGTAEWYTPDSTMDFLSIAFGMYGVDQKFIAVGQNGGVIGGGGLRWGLNLTVPGTMTQTLRRVHYGNAWVIVGDSNGTNACVATLSVGNTITDRSTTAAYGAFSLKGVASRAVSATTRQYIAVGTGDDGAGHAKVLRFTFDGTTWAFTTLTPATLPAGNYTAIAYLEHAAKWVIVGDNGDGVGKLYVSSDDGTTWTAAQVKEFKAGVFEPSAYTSIYYDVTTSTALITGADSVSAKGVLVSTSDGVVFETRVSAVVNVGMNPPVSHWDPLLYDVAGYRGVWVATAGLNHVWVSIDNARTWELSVGSEGGYLGGINEVGMHSVAVSPYNSRGLGHKWVIGSALIYQKSKYYGSRALVSMSLMAS